MTTGAKERGGWGWLRLWGGGVGAVCVSLSDGDALLSPELIVGSNRDVVDWTFLPPPGIVLRGGTNVSSPLVARYLQRRGE